MPGESDRILTAVFILGIVVITVGLGFYEEYRAEKELEALDRLLQFKATVRRDGVSQTIDADEVVPGDIVAPVSRTEGGGRRCDFSKPMTCVSMNRLLPERAWVWTNHLKKSIGTPHLLSVPTWSSAPPTSLMAREWPWRSARGWPPKSARLRPALEQIGERPTPFELEVQVMARQMTVIVALLGHNPGADTVLLAA